VKSYEDSPRVNQNVLPSIKRNPSSRAGSPLKVGDSFEKMKEKMVSFDDMGYKPQKIERLKQESMALAPVRRSTSLVMLDSISERQGVLWSRSKYMTRLAPLSGSASLDNLMSEEGEPPEVDTHAHIPNLIEEEHST
jgi:hypothetical protein